jgi:hypothetical protein
MIQMNFVMAVQILILIAASIRLVCLLKKRPRDEDK